MNMNKALQNIYKAISGKSTSKVNISKLLVDIHYALSGKYPTVKNNWAKIIDSMAENWPGTYTLLGYDEFEVSTDSTSEISVGSISAGEDLISKDKIIFVKIYDKAGKRNGHFYMSSAWMQTPTPIESSRGTFGRNGVYLTSTTVASFTTKNGVYASDVSANGDVSIKAKYSASTGTIDGTFAVEVYAIDWPNNESPF